ncbi:MAG: 4-(cytidine 5'-diphospho)-2-C-methyl-D-erythritol kinase [Rhodospirillales bacterium]|nr:4-(cytidine 5'-diphospho)-2-C-methyl-D-erythritol kinase [Rhodospirillales bacterium]
MDNDSPLSFAAAAKLNLYLHVIGRRADGLHLLDSLVAFAAVHDRLTIEPASQLSLANTGPFGDGLPTTSENLVLRAAEQLRELAGISQGAHITLSKQLPIASGIGGGSADAAAIIRGLVRFWHIHPGHHDLSGLALDLGADVPICLFGQAAFMGGIGEQIEPVPSLPAAPLLLVNPGVAVSTPAIFKARTGTFSKASRFDEAPATLDELVETLANGRGNDLTEPAIATAPVIGDVLAMISEMPGCRLARMSGSGATCFGIFDTPSAADQAAARIKTDRPHWWCVSSHLLSDTRSL